LVQLSAHEKKKAKRKNKWINSTNLKLGRYKAWENVKGDI
jgi:hypothetical protein